VLHDDSRSSSDGSVDHVTCLGCGCSCDDITVIARGGRITEARHACALGGRWFGTGQSPARITASARGGEKDSDIASALEQTAKLLECSRRTLVYLSTDISCETQRAAIGIADALGATIDSVTTAGTREWVLTGQRRGYITATLGEIRNRADTVVFWGVDPAIGYPRFTSRYAPDPVGLYVKSGRRGRKVIAVDVGAERGPSDADARVAFAAGEEVAALGLMRMFLLQRGHAAAVPGSVAGRANDLASRLVAARYVAVVADGEARDAPDNGRGEALRGEALRGEALSRLLEALNRSVRAALITLRGGGNRSGADAALTWQTGHPMAVDFSSGAPVYRPEDGAASLLAAGEIDTVLIVGSPQALTDRMQAAFAGAASIVIGPRASESPFPTVCAIDTGVAGIQERGMAIRMDGIPLPLRPALEERIVREYHMAERDGQGSELAIARALAAAGRPQDSYLLLRALTTMLSRQ
jgi:formylmethanofuran dehydrogenase subunit B